jgi:hypothetical protein
MGMEAPDYEIIVGLPKASKKCGAAALRTRRSPLKNAAQALLPVPIFKEVRRIDTAEAVGV